MSSPLPDRLLAREVRKELAGMGYELARSKRHLIYKHKCGATISVSKSASDPRAFKNLLSDARRALRERGVEGGYKVGSF